MAQFGIGEEIMPGGLEAVRNALSRRRSGESTSPLTQVGGATPSPNNIGLQGPPTPTQPPQGLQAPGGTPQGGQAPLPTPETPQNQIMNREAEIILRAMSNRLGAISKGEQPQPQPQANIPPNLMGV